MDDLTFKKRLKKIILIIVVLLVLLIGWSVYRSTSFHVVSTNPIPGNVTTVTSVFSINFSQDLESSGLSVSSNPTIIKSVSVNKKTLELGIYVPLNSNQNYKITVSSIYSSSGKKLSNLSYSFTPQFVNVSNNSLPSQQQNSLLEQQSAAAPNQPPTFLGTDALLSAGASTDQVSDFETAVSNFCSSKKIPLKTASIETSSVTTAPLSAGSGVFGIDFTVNIQGENYPAELTYSNLTSAELYLYSITSGAQIFDSGVISP